MSTKNPSNKKKKITDKVINKQFNAIDRAMFSIEQKVEELYSEVRENYRRKSFFRIRLTSQEFLRTSVAISSIGIAIKYIFF